MTAALDLAAFEGHTPGPWHTSDTRTAIHYVKADLTYIATVSSLLDGKKNAERLIEESRNAALLAAAPALLAECRTLRARVAELEAEGARLREALMDAAAFIALAADRGVLNGEEVSGMIEDYQAALGAKPL